MQNGRGSNLISWKTATEINASHFIIERYNETEGDYEAQGKVLAHGNSATLQQYKWEDFDLARAGTYTYRLAQYDFDGTVNFSPSGVCVCTQRGKGKSAG